MEQNLANKLVQAIDDLIDAKIGQADARNDNYMEYSYGKDVAKASYELEKLVEEILKKP